MISGVNGSSSIKKKNIRGKVLIKAINALQRSKLSLFLITFIIGILFLIFTKHKYVIIASIPFLFYYKELIFEILVIIHAIEYLNGTFKWYNKVDDDGIYLGAIPIMEDHSYLISKKLNINAVLTINEEYELNCNTLIGKPITSNEWQNLNVDHLVLYSPDFKPPSFELLIKGSDWINKQVVQHKKVYVHCKSGMGRSASLVAAYLMRYKFMDPHTARATIAMKRPVIFSVKSSQLKNLIKFESYLRTRK